MSASGEAGRRVLMIGIDAAEGSLIRKWMNEGYLPHFSALLERGAWATLQPTADWMVGGLWPTFYSSRPIDSLGMYHYLVWRPDRMATERPDPEWMPLEPFWRDLPAPGRRVVALDVPLCYAPVGSSAVEVSGWATHELLQEPGSSPAGLLRRIRREFGDAPFGEESAVALSAAEYLDVGDQCIETARRAGEVGQALMQRNAWDLALICFSSAHRAGHQLWDRSNLKGTATPSQLDAIDHALRDVYVACDAAAGRLIEQAGEGADVMVFSLHGMGVNSDRTVLLPEMLARILEGRRTDGAPVLGRRVTDRLRGLVPADLRARIKTRLPRIVQDKLTVYWRANQDDWSRTRAFVAFCDLDGYVRINLRGREREGVVTAEEYRPLCERIAEGISSFRDADTGVPVVEEIQFADQIFGDGPRRSHLPDLVIRWAGSPAVSMRAVESEQYGCIPWPTPGRHPAGRGGNHRRAGFLIAGGETFRRTSLADPATIFDLAPTALQLLGLPLPQSFRGKSLLIEET